MSRRLGRGLESLIHEIDTPNPGSISKVEINLIRPNRFQPRRTLDPEKLKELSDSIKENGLIQPIVVGKHTDTDYELIAGERRLEACKMAGMTEIPVFVKEVTDQERLVLAIIENVQRENLSPIEEAKAYQRLIDEFDLAHQDIAKIMNKDRATITNTLRLLKLSDIIQNLIDNKQITAGHARAILSIEEGLQEKFAFEIIDKQYSVRQAEDISKNYQTDDQKSISTSKQKNYERKYLKKIEIELMQSFGLPVKVKERKNSTGEIIIQFENKEVLDNLLDYIKETNFNFEYKEPK